MSHRANIAAWINTTQSSSFAYVICRLDAATPKRSWAMRVHHGRFNVFLSQDGSQGTTVSQNVLVRERVDTGEWTHLAFTWDPIHQLRMYVNGQEVTGAGLDIERNPPLTHLHDPENVGVVVGNRVAAGEGQQFAGLVSEAAIWDHALGPEEIAWLHHNSLADLPRPSPPPAAAHAGRLRVGIFSDAGVGRVGAWNVPGTLVEDHPPYSHMRHIDAEDVRSGILPHFDVVVFPGGSGSGQANALGPDGREHVMDFIASGGGYMGICAGGYLAGSGRPEYLHLIPFRHNLPWALGGGYVDVEVTDAGRLRLANPAAGMLSIRYGNGPIFVDDAGNPADFAAAGIEVLAHYRSAVREGSEVMIDQPAIVYGHHGKGRYISVSPHPETAGDTHLYWVIGSGLRLVGETAHPFWVEPFDHPTLPVNATTLAVTLHACPPTGDSPQSYPAWAIAHIADPNAREPGVDRGGHGIANLVAYATGVNPLHGTELPLAVQLQEGYARIELPWCTSLASTVGVWIEQSHDLHHWEPADVAHWEAAPHTGDRLLWSGRVAIDPGAPQRHFRACFKLLPAATPLTVLQEWRFDDPAGTTHQVDGDALTLARMELVRTDVDTVTLSGNALGDGGRLARQSQGPGAPLTAGRSPWRRGCGRGQAGGRRRRGPRP